MGFFSWGLDQHFVVDVGLKNFAGRVPDRGGWQGLGLDGRRFCFSPVGIIVIPCRHQRNGDWERRRRNRRFSTLRRRVAMAAGRIVVGWRIGYDNPAGTIRSRISNKEASRNILLRLALVGVTRFELVTSTV